ncbi:MAG: glutamine--fructose-6-phosphate transaminase (isomerizing) [Candidatus Pacebacteria bacterium]|nr:glutamine--fructose-6-phosphate transaminase (isomerizing) [Candidatus Paceibacterota bacterium]MCF7857592.1 glutamine--fructose-6-phosphate transaminase (isomerizing) [Candidatus Paceibacterota bacterium]
MCGIFGYVGTRTAEPLLIEGLRTLEYRGYDSAGVYIPGHGSIKAAGPIDNLAKKISSTISGTSGIAHTRWATHGAPTELNAHPHSDMSGAVWIVHNGIIENYRELREGLQVSGITFESDTDTEVLAKLIGSFNYGDLHEAVRKALQVVRGTYGIAVLSEQAPHEIIVVRMGSPIVLGIGLDGNFVSSDASALLAHTKDVVYLDDGDVAVITKEGYNIVTLHGESKEKTPEKIEWDIESIQKKGYDHFLLKEIMEIPETIENTIRGRLVVEKGRAKLGGLENVLPELAAIDRLMVVACGSAAYAGQVGKYMIEEYAGLPVDVELGSEFRYRTVIPHKNSALLAVTQSGETADTLASIRKGKDLGLLTLGMVNVVGSTIAREADAGIYNHAGPEISIASTKAFISQLTAFVLMTLLIGRERGLSQKDGIEIATALSSLPEAARKILATTEQIKRVAEKYANARDMMYIGRNTHSAIAYEGSLKLKEVTYIHAEAYAGGELKHGPIAMLDKNFPVVALVPHDAVYEKMISNIEEVKARNAPVIAIATEGDTQISDIVDDVLYIPKVHPIVQPILSVIPLQLFAYHIGVSKGLNVDRPRNLAKAVTVE